jgi:hypothetical protein
VNTRFSPAGASKLYCSRLQASTFQRSTFKLMLCLCVLSPLSVVFIYRLSSRLPTHPSSLLHADHPPLHGRHHRWRAIHHEVIALSLRPTPHAATDDAGPRPSISRYVFCFCSFFFCFVYHCCRALDSLTSPRRRLLRLRFAARNHVITASDSSSHASPPPPLLARKTRCNATPTRRAIPAATALDDDDNQVDDDGDAEGCGVGDAKDDGDDGAEGAGTTRRRERR